MSNEDRPMQPRQENPGKTTTPTVNSHTTTTKEEPDHQEVISTTNPVTDHPKIDLSTTLEETTIQSKEWKNSLPEQYKTY